jgi:hypothetical protein
MIGVASHVATTCQNANVRPVKSSTAIPCATKRSISTAIAARVGGGVIWTAREQPL